MSGAELFTTINNLSAVNAKSFDILANDALRSFVEFAGKKGTCPIIAIEGTTAMRMNNRWQIKMKLRLKYYNWLRTFLISSSSTLVNLPCGKCHRSSILLLPAPPHLVDLNPRLSILHIPNLGKQSHLIQSPHQCLRLTPSGHIKRHIKGNTSNPPVGHLGLPEVQQMAPSKYVQHRYQPKRQK